MFTKQVQDLPLYFFNGLSSFPNLKHYVSTRHGGVSEGDVASLNVSFTVEPSKENVLENRAKIAQAMGVSPKKLLFPSQVHEDRINHITPNWGTAQSEEELKRTDALITQERGICLSVIAADCVPLLIYDTAQEAIGAAHAGWRGTVKKIAQKTVQKMTALFGTNPADVWVGIGPSAGPNKYEVGPEVVEAFKEAFGERDNLILQPQENGKAHINLWEANKIQLTDIGVPAKQIEIAGLCTISNPDTFFSARCAGGKGGRFASGIMLK